MGPPALPDDRIKVHVAAAILRQAGVEDSGGLTTRFANLISLKGKFDDLGHGSALPARETMREIARLGTADG